MFRTRLETESRGGMARASLVPSLLAPPGLSPRERVESGDAILSYPEVLLRALTLLVNVLCTFICACAPLPTTPEINPYPTQINPRKGCKNEKNDLAICVTPYFNPEQQ